MLLKPPQRHSRTLRGGEIRKLAQKRFLACVPDGPYRAGGVFREEADFAGIGGAFGHARTLAPASISVNLLSRTDLTHYRA